MDVSFIFRENTNLNVSYLLIYMYSIIYNTVIFKKKNPDASKSSYLESFKFKHHSEVFERVFVCDCCECVSL